MSVCFPPPFILSFFFFFFAILFFSIYLFMILLIESITFEPCTNCTTERNTHVHLKVFSNIAYLQNIFSLVLRVQRFIFRRSLRFSDLGLANWLNGCWESFKEKAPPLSLLQTKKEKISLMRQSVLYLFLSHTLCCP